MPRTITIDDDLAALIDAFRAARTKREATPKGSPERALADENESLTAALVAHAVANRVEGR